MRMFLLLVVVLPALLTGVMAAGVQMDLLPPVGQADRMGADGSVGPILSWFGLFATAGLLVFAVLGTIRRTRADRR